jgi:hypothetical protein
MLSPEAPTVHPDPPVESGDESGAPGEGGKDAAPLCW